MDDPERVVQAFLKSYVEVLRTMTEAQVVDSLRAVEGFRRHEREMLGWLKSVSLASTEDSTGEINQLKSDLNLHRRPPISLSSLLRDHMEEALKKRLETLRKRPNNNS